jgi:hypothetical protein
VTAPLTHVCPVCHGEQGGGPFCLCDGMGAITAEAAQSWVANGGMEPAPLPEQPKRLDRPCRDCAFRRGSPERADIRVAESLMQKVESGSPFYCHVAMPVDHTGHYVPPKGVDGERPIGAPVCAGYAETRRRFLAGERLAFLRPKGRPFQEPTR